MKRRGASLIEVLIVVAALATVMAVTGPLIRVLALDTPKVNLRIAAAASFDRMVQQLRRDVQLTRRLSVEATDDEGEAGRLVLETDEGVLVYTFTDGRVTRDMFDAHGRPIEAAMRLWSVPGGKISWSVRNPGRRGEAVVVRTAIQRRRVDGVVDELANTHVLFTTADGRAGQ